MATIGLHSESILPEKRQVITDHEWTAVSNSLRLSRRELQLMQAVCAELKDRAIADQLGISVHTVRTHFERLFRKLGVHSRVGLVVCAYGAIRNLHAGDGSNGETFRHSLKASSNPTSI